MIDSKKLFEAINSLSERYYKLEKYLVPSILEQKHLDKGSIEEAYWNYGYYIALRDVLILLDTCIISGDK